MFLSGPPTAQLMQTMWAGGASPSFYGMSTVSGYEVAQALGQRLRGLAISQIVPYPWSDADAVARDSRRAAARPTPTSATTASRATSMPSCYSRPCAAADVTPTRQALHSVMRSMKGRIAGLDLDFTGASPTGSRFVEMVHVTAKGQFVR